MSRSPSGSLSSRRWERTRKAVFERDGHRCRQCGRASRLEAHHVSHLHQGGDPWGLDNIETRCRSCHIDEHRRPVSPAEAAWRRLVEELV